MTCKDCGVSTEASARCPSCWDDKCGGSKKRDEAAEKYASTNAPEGLVCPTRLYGFIAGWDAATAEAEKVTDLDFKNGERFDAVTEYHYQKKITELIAERDAALAEVESARQQGRAEGLEMAARYIDPRLIMPTAIALLELAAKEKA